MGIKDEISIAYHRSRSYLTYKGFTTAGNENDEDIRNVPWTIPCKPKTARCTDTFRVHTVYTPVLQSTISHWDKTKDEGDRKREEKERERERERSGATKQVDRRSTDSLYSHIGIGQTTGSDVGAIMDPYRVDHNDQRWRAHLRLLFERRCASRGADSTECPADYERAGPRS